MKNTNCIYCEDKKPSEHFICDVCGVGMCDDCYDSEVEHTGHYHEICEATNDKQYKMIVAKVGHEPAYLCEKCLEDIINNK